MPWIKRPQLQRLLTAAATLLVLCALLLSWRHRLTATAAQEQLSEIRAIVAAREVSRTASAPPPARPLTRLLDDTPVAVRTHELVRSASGRNRSILTLQTDRDALDQLFVALERCREVVLELSIELTEAQTFSRVIIEEPM